MEIVWGIRRMSRIMMLSIIFGVRQDCWTEYLMTYVRRGYGEEVGGMYHTGNCTTETVSTRCIHLSETMICDWGPLRRQLFSIWTRRQ